MLIMTERKLVNGHYRALLLKFFMDRKLSIPTQETILDSFWICPEDKKEQLAEEILDLIKDCETEEEILQKLKDIIE